MLIVKLPMEQYFLFQDSTVNIQLVQMMPKDNLQQVIGNEYLYLTNIFTVDLRDYPAMFLELSPPKPLDQSKNVTIRTFHTWPGSVHEHIFLVLGGAMSPRRHVAKHGPKGRAKRSH